MTKNGISYRDAGVDIDAGNALVDRIKPAAAATRQRFAAMLADEKLPFTGYHLPFPAVGYVQRDGEAFRYVPETYALMVEDAAPASNG